MSRQGQGVGVVDPLIFDDPDFIDISREAQVMFFYLICGYEAIDGMPGIMVMTAESLAVALRMGTIDARRCLQEIEAKGFVRTDAALRLLEVPAAPRYRRPGNPNVLKGWHRKWSRFPDCALKDDIAVRALEAWREKFGDKESMQRMLDQTFQVEVDAISKALSKRFQSASEALSSQSAFDFGGESEKPSDTSNLNTTTGQEDEALSKRSITVISKQVTGNRDQEELDHAEALSSVARPVPVATDRRDAALRLWELQEDLRQGFGDDFPRREMDPGSMAVVMRAMELYTEAELENALRVDAAACGKDRSQLQWFNGYHNWQPKHLQRVVGQVPPRSTGYQSATKRKFGRGSALGKSTKKETTRG